MIDLPRESLATISAIFGNFRTSSKIIAKGLQGVWILVGVASFQVGYSDVFADQGRERLGTSCGHRTLKLAISALDFRLLARLMPEEEAIFGQSSGILNLGLTEGHLPIRVWAN